MIVAEGGRLQKLNGLTHIFWDALADDQGEVKLPSLRMAIRIAYVSDLMVLRIVEFSGEQLAVSRDELFPVKPSLSHVGEVELPESSRPSLNSRVQAHVFHVTSAGGEALRAEVRGGDDRFIRFSEDTSGACLGVDDLNYDVLNAMEWTPWLS